MKHRSMRCRECKEHFDVVVNKDFTFMREVSGLPSCNHHTDTTRAGRRKDAKQKSEAAQNG